MINFAEKLLQRTVAQMMTKDPTDECTSVAEFDLVHAFADPRGEDPSRPKPRTQPHTRRDPDLAKIRQLQLEFIELVQLARERWMASVGQPTAAAAAAADPTTAATIAEWGELFEYAYERILHGYAHRVQAANEAGVPRQLIHSLQYGQAGVISDWKAKWLSLVFREKQTEFFGKSGMGWHGTMLYVRLQDDEIEIAYYHAIMGAHPHRMRHTCRRSRSAHSMRGTHHSPLAVCHH